MRQIQGRELAAVEVEIVERGALTYVQRSNGVLAEVGDKYRTLDPDRGLLDDVLDEGIVLPFSGGDALYGDGLVCRAAEIHLQLTTCGSIGRESDALGALLGMQLAGTKDACTE